MQRRGKPTSAAALKTALAHLALLLASLFALGPFVLMLGKSLDLFYAAYPIDGDHRGPVWIWMSDPDGSAWRLLWEDRVLLDDGSTLSACAHVSASVPSFYLQALVLALVCTPLVAYLSRKSWATPRTTLLGVLLLLAALPMQILAWGLLADTLTPTVRQQLLDLEMLPRFGLTLLFCLALAGPLMMAGGLYVRAVLQEAISRRHLFLLLLWCACSITLLIPLSQLLQPAGSEALHIITGARCYTHINSRVWSVFAAFSLISGLPAALLGIWLFQRGILEQLVCAIVEPSFKSRTSTGGIGAGDGEEHR